MELPMSLAKKVFHLGRSEGIAYSPTYASLTRPQCELTRGDSNALLTHQLTELLYLRAHSYDRLPSYIPPVM